MQKGGLMSGLMFVAVMGWAVMNSAVVAAASGDMWMAKPLVVERSVEIPLQYREACSGIHREVRVVGASKLQTACLFSSPQLRIGTYFAAQYQMLASPGIDTAFRTVKGACHLSGCQYSTSYDTLLMRQNTGSGVGLAVYQAVRDRLQPTPGDLGATYTFDKSNPALVIDEEVNAVALSANGRWAVFEVRNRGILLMDVVTLTMRRLFPYSVPYGVGFNPSYEMAVSDDGQTVALMGMNVNLMMVVVTPECGEVVREKLRSASPVGTIPCLAPRLNSGDVASDFYAAREPRFDTGGGRLDLKVQTLSGRYRQLTLRAGGYEVSPLDYLALGDSFTSGEGDAGHYLLGTDQSVDRCHVSERSYPFVLAQRLGITGGRVQNVACSGAVLLDIRGTLGYQGQGGRMTGYPQANLITSQALEIFQQGRVPQLLFVDRYRPAAVTVGVGGNDAGLVKKLSSCAMPGTCEWVQPLRRQQVEAEIRAIAEPLGELYAQLRSVSPYSRLYAVGYPRIMRDSDQCDSVTSVLFDDVERRFILETLDYLNVVVRTVAERAGVMYLDIADSFGESALCGVGFSAMNTLEWGGDIAALTRTGVAGLFRNESFHPNWHGHHLIAMAIERQISDFLGLACIQVACSISQSTASIPFVSEQGLPRLLSMDSVVEDSVPKASPITLLATAATFQPLSSVAVVIDGQTVAQQTASDEGSFIATLSVPESVGYGVQTVYLVGKDAAARDIEVYDTVLVIEAVGKEGVTSLTASMTRSILGDNDESAPLLGRIARPVSGHSSHAPERVVLGATNHQPASAVAAITQRTYTFWWFIVGVVVVTVLASWLRLWRRRKRHRI